ncbi:MAG: magnesium transporter [Clostridia bacterium]|nr:magnesium transporter [Clostridia bacterium]
MDTAMLISRVTGLIADKKWASLKLELSQLEAIDIADCLFALWDDEEIGDDTLALIFRVLPKELASEVFSELDNDMQQVLVQAFSDSELREIMSELYLDDAVDIIEEMPANAVKRLLQAVDSDTRKTINHLLNYPENSAGSIMTTEYVSLRPDMTVAQSFERIRKTGVDKETVYTCYVLDGSRRLVGIVTVKDLLLADYEQTVSEIMEEHVISANTLTDREEVAHTLSRYAFLALPIVDGENRLVGIVTVDDAIDVLQEETTEDLEKMTAITPSERSYTRTGVIELVKNRIPWLMLLMLSATFTGMIITSFESALAAQAALTAFIPMLMSTAGNSGSQSSVTVLRSMSLGELEFSDIFKVLYKELRVAALCAVALACVNFAKMYLVDFLLLDNNGLTVPVMAVVCLTLGATVVFAKLVGCTLPMLAKKIGLDPAVMASPFITTIVDTVTLLVYFRFASAILNI